MAQPVRCSDRKAVSAADRDAQFWVMCSFPECIIYIHRYILHGNMSILLSEVHEPLLWDSQLNFTDLVQNAVSRMRAKQMELNEIQAQ